MPELNKHADIIGALEWSGLLLVVSLNYFLRSTSLIEICVREVFSVRFLSDLFFERTTKEFGFQKTIIGTSKLDHLLPLLRNRLGKE